VGLSCFCGCVQPPDLLLIRDVTVIDGTGNNPQPHMTVVIEKGRIKAIDREDSLGYPSSARTIDGTGKYLIPGLWDMHVHLRDLDDTLALFIINGVTSVRDMGSELGETVALRERIEAGTLVGPNIKTSGMMLESKSWLEQYVDLMRAQGRDKEAIEEFLRTRIAVGDNEEAREAVHSLISRGADFIKIRHAESPEVFAAISQAAVDNGTHVAGHYVWIIGLDESANGGQRSIEHNILPGFNGRNAEEKQVIFNAMLRNDTHIVPTLVTNKMETLPFEQASAIAHDAEGAIDIRNRYVSNRMRESWVETVALNAADEERPPPELIHKMITDSNEFLYEARQAGVQILAGTDCPTTGTFLGFSLHEELALLVETYGMTPMEALRSATVLSAAFMDLDAEVGTIEAGKRADLVLLDADPLSDVTNTQRIDTVITNGRVFDKASREALLEEIQDSITSGREGPESPELQ
jgi:imidazolonepropionase-like amidohydrolase